jgi:HK97 family phage prohead protease
MAISLNGAGKSHAASLIATGKVDKDSSWSMSADDENKILGDKNWTEYGKWFLGVDASADKETKAHWHYPFGKNGKVYRSALIAIRQRAGQQGVDEIFKAAGTLLEKIDGKKEGDSMDSYIEHRIFPMAFRAVSKDETPKIGGVAAVFNSLSEDLGGFREQIVPGAFKSCLNNADIRALINHNPDKIMGRTTSKTLRLAETDKGLEWDCDAPDTSYARDLAVSVQRGDINQCSFSFAVDDGGDTWQKDNAGMWTRSIHVVARLYDVSPVTYPAYPDTSCAVRSLDKIRAAEKPPFDHIGFQKMRHHIESIS